MPNFSTELEEIKILQRWFQEFKISYIPRGQNIISDSLLRTYLSIKKLCFVSCSIMVWLPRHLVVLLWFDCLDTSSLTNIMVIWCQKKENVGPVISIIYWREKITFAMIENDIKFSDRYSSKFSRYIYYTSLKLSGLKSHNCHLIS